MLGGISRAAAASPQQHIDSAPALGAKGLVTLQVAFAAAATGRASTVPR